MYAIQRISDGELLPASRSGHASYAEFGNGLPPRIFTTSSGAHACLRNWCQGYWRTAKEFEATNEYGDGFYYQVLPVPIGKGMRNRQDYRVVKIKLEVVD